MLLLQDLLMAPLLSIPTVIKELVFEYGLFYMFPTLFFYCITITAVAYATRNIVPKVCVALQKHVFVWHCFNMGISPWLIYWQMASLRNRSDGSTSMDLFTLGVVSYCMGMSLLTEWMGLSHEAGALLAGLVLTDTPNISKAVVSIEPLTCLFGGMYMGSLGMILSPVSTIT